jgi:hypothetical protein
VLERLVEAEPEMLALPERVGEVEGETGAVTDAVPEPLLLAVSLAELVSLALPVSDGLDVREALAVTVALLERLLVRELVPLWLAVSVDVPVAVILAEDVREAVAVPLMVVLSVDEGEALCRQTGGRAGRWVDVKAGGLGHARPSRVRGGRGQVVTGRVRV